MRTKVLYYCDYFNALLYDEAYHRNTPSFVSLSSIHYIFTLFGGFTHFSLFSSLVVNVIVWLLL
jgi:hypothetical protein